ncbi:hypothetical protein LTR08_004682 [Meristemomyces frigidus]|nr:hypothetical protein LTR08_004682 [Meristemomyces frigidus]
MARKLQFADLETELQALIVEKVLRPTDLVSLLLTSHHLHALALKPLYRTISLDLGNASDTRLAAFLSPANKGLAHIRTLRLYLAHVRDRCGQKVQAALMTRMILEFLPEGGLERFCLPELKKNPRMLADTFAHARKLVLYPENRATLDLCHFFVAHTTPALEELVVHANFDAHPAQHDGPPPAPDARELNDSATAPGLLVRTIFAHFLPLDTCTPFAHLTSLRLHHVSLRYCAATWLRIVPFARIQHLLLYHCPGAAALFAHLGTAAHLPRNLHTLEFQHKDDDQDEALLALDGFLCLVSGLRELVVDLEGVSTLPAAAGVARHGKTLALLSIHGSRALAAADDMSSGAEELVWSAEEFDKVCKACAPRLEQLSCAWPATSLIRAASEEWQGFERGVVGRLRGLVTLQITTFPSNKPSGQLLPRAVYQVLLGGVAGGMFELARGVGGGLATAADAAAAAVSEEDTSTPPLTPPLPPSRLRLIAFGISETVYERADAQNQLLYLRSPRTQADGREGVWAAPIGSCLRQFVEPRSECLDFVLKRRTEVPCREREVGVGGWGMGLGIGGEEDE